MTLSAIHKRSIGHGVFRWLEVWRTRRIRASLRKPAAAAADQVRRLYVDVSVISKHDAGTGIQRFVRSVASHLQQVHTGRWQVVLVAASRKQSYASCAEPGGTTAHSLVGRPGDIFLGLDFALDTVYLHRRQLADFKRSGGEVWFVLFDLLPAQRPDWFSDKLVKRFRRWFRVLAGIADGFFCISPPVEADLRRELEGGYGLQGGYRTHVLPMGWDIAGSRPSVGRPEGFDLVLSQIRQRQTALMVGTVEPRKAHGDVLAAFNELWRSGCAFNLVIVGRAGWKTEELQSQFRSHPELQKRLFWLDNASDEALTQIYRECDGVIAASYAEGFGLPVIEALGHGKPVLARSLPVFQLHASNDVTYFPVDAGTARLASDIRSWLEREPPASRQTPITLPTWTDTANQIVVALDTRLS